MGLDMYLHADKYLPRWEHTRAEGRHAADNALQAAGLADAQVENAGVTVRATVMKWRKANAIHRWFVDTLAGGKDECPDIYVDLERIQELRDLCQKVLDAPELGPKLLPTQDGFSFGGTDYDDWYIQDLKDTVAGLTRVLDLPDTDRWDFTYRASW